MERSTMLGDSPVTLKVARKRKYNKRVIEKMLFSMKIRELPWQHNY